jgi:hypothetical protein
MDITFRIVLGKNSDGDPKVSLVLPSIVKTPTGTMEMLTPVGFESFVGSDGKPGTFVAIGGQSLKQFARLMGMDVPVAARFAGRSDTTAAAAPAAAPAADAAGAGF